MWCKKCYRETYSKKCEFCGSATESENSIEIFWCNNCKIPIIKYANDIDKDICSLCKQETSYLCADLRPVFPEERLLFEILQGKPLAYLNDSVWASNNRYYINGNPVAITTKFYKKNSPRAIRKQLYKYQSQNSPDFFDENIKTFININKNRLNYIIDEAHSFIKNTANLYPRECVVISFSGGKDNGKKNKMRNHLQKV